MRGIKFKILNLLVLIIAIVNLIIVFADGSHMTARTMNRFADNCRIEDAKVKMSAEGVIEYMGCHLDPDDHSLLIDVKSIGKGETDLKIKVRVVYPGGNSISIKEKKHFEIGFFGLVLDTTGMVDFNNYRISVFSVFLALLLTVLFMLWEYLDNNKNGEFSYSMVACGALAFFSFVALIFGVYKYINNAVKTFGDYINTVTGTGQVMLLMLTPFMLVMSVFLMFSNIWLIKHEGKRLVNTLGIVFGLIWAIATIVLLGPYILYNVYIPMPSILRYVLTYVMCYFECMFIVTGFSAVLATKYTPDHDRDYIIILGCRIRKDGTLTPLLKGRADAAISFEQKQFDETGKHAIFVPSGGKGDDEISSEAESMKRYLLEKGIPKERILIEDKSANTYENLNFSKAVIEADSGDIKKKKIAFATTNYHIFRGYVLSRKNDYIAKGISASTKRYFYPNAFLREFIGLLVDQLPRHIMYVSMMCLFFLAMWVPSW